MLKPQDVVLALKLLCKGKADWSQGGLAQELVMSASEVNAGLKRLAFAGLIEKQSDGRKWQVIKPALREFLLYGIKYVFPAEKGAPAVGIPTANAAQPLKNHVEDTGMLPVWPSKQGKSKGYALQPLYPTVPQAALQDAELYQWLTIVDALRDHDNDAMDIAIVTLKEKLAGRKPQQLAQEAAAEPAAARKDDQQLDLLA